MSLIRKSGGHTTGPWKRDGNRIWVPGRGVIAVIPMPNADGVYDCEANAHLISAAPDLKESLESFMGMWGSMDARSESKRAQKRRADMWDKAQSAIAKAEGYAEVKT